MSEKTTLILFRTLRAAKDGFEETIRDFGVNRYYKAIKSEMVIETQLGRHEYRGADEPCYLKGCTWDRVILEERINFNFLQEVVYPGFIKGERK